MTDATASSTDAPVAGDRDWLYRAASRALINSMLDQQRKKLTLPVPEALGLEDQHEAVRKLAVTMSELAGRYGVEIVYETAILSGSEGETFMKNVSTSSTNAHLAGGSDRLYGAMWEAMSTASSKDEADHHFNAAIGIMLGILERVDPKSWRTSPSMMQYALMGCTLVLCTGSAQPGDIPTLAKVGQALRDLDYRATLLERYAKTVGTTDMVYEFWTVHEPVLPETQKTSLAVLLRRFDQLRLTTPLPDEESQIAGFSRP